MAHYNQNSLNTSPVLSEGTFEISSIEGETHRIRIFKQYGKFRIEPSFSPQGDFNNKKILSLTGDSIIDIFNQINSTITHQIIGRA